MGGRYKRVLFLVIFLLLMLLNSFFVIADKDDVEKKLKEAGVVYNKDNLEFFYKNEELPFIVRYDRNNRKKNIDDIERMVKNNEGRILHKYKTIPYLSVSLPADKIDDFSEDMSRKGIKNARIFLDEISYIHLDKSIPKVRANEVWQIKDSQGRFVTGIDSRIAIIDTGIDHTHPDFSGRIIAEEDVVPGSLIINGIDFGDGDDDHIADDNIGHGTHVAGIAAGSGYASNGTYKGVAPGAGLIPVKVFTDNTIVPIAFNSWVIAGIEFAIANDADVISMSLGSNTSSEPFRDAMLNAISNNIVVIASLGNDGPNYFTASFPGRMEEVIGVGSITDTDAISSFSSRGPTKSALLKPDLLAPGSNICSAKSRIGFAGLACLDDDYTDYSGTSMSAPHVAGAAALLKQLHPDWDNNMIRAAIINSARNTGLNPYAQGAGILDIKRASKIVILPEIPVINFGTVIGTGTVDTNISIKNTGTSKYGVRLVGFKFKNLNNVEYVVNYQFSENNFCLNAGETKDVKVTFDFQNLNNGPHSSIMTITPFPNCNFNANTDAEQITNIPVGADITTNSCDKEVRTRATMSKDITGCSQNGLIIDGTSHVLDSTFTIDCKSHLIRGNNVENNNDGIEGILLLAADHVIIKNCDIEGFYNGIGVLEGLPPVVIVKHQRDMLIINNKIKNHTKGIELERADNAEIIYNYFEDNTIGIEFDSGTNNSRIMNNTINNSGIVKKSRNSIGVSIGSYSKNNLIKWNKIYNSNGGITGLTHLNNSIDDNYIKNIQQWGINVPLSTDINIRRNTIDGSKIAIHIVGQRNAIYNNAVIKKREDHIIKDNIINNANISGIRLYNRIDNIIVEGNTITDTKNGITLYNYTSNNTIRNNLITNSQTFSYYGDSGINISKNSDGNNLSNNAIINNKLHGIRVSLSKGNVLEKNFIVNSRKAIYLMGEGTADNIIIGNTITDNPIGILLNKSAENNTIKSNVFENNLIGIKIASSNNNLIYNNKFTNINANSKNAEDNGTNIWNIARINGKNIINGIYIAGNFWDDYIGQDANGDGIGDTNIPYNSNGNIINGGDNMPLIVTTSTSTTSTTQSTTTTRRRRN